MSIATNGQTEQHIKIDNINSSYDEHSPVLSPDGSRLYFTRSGHASNIAGVIDQGDIWYAEKTESGWSNAIHGGEAINHPGLNGVVGFSADGNRMYTLNYFDPDERGGGNLRNGISVSNLVGGEWSRPERLRIRYFSNNSPQISATISRDEKILIMSIDSYNSEGNEDLYVSFAQADGEWSQPKNIGSQVNTYAEEWAPFLASDNETLYFASNGFDGQGSRDIYVTKRIDGSWSDWTPPENLGSSLNTKGTERGYFIPTNGQIAYFSSTQNSEGFGDIFNFQIPQSQRETEVVVDTPEATEEPVVEEEPVVVAMTFGVVDKRTENPVDAQVTLAYGNKEIGVNTATIDTQNKHFMVTLEQGAKVNVTIEAPGFLKYQEEFTADATPRVDSDDFSSGVELFRLTPEDVGTTVEIENVLFNRASASFSEPDVAKGEIDKLVELMKANPGMAIRLEGHTDNRGDAELLKELSEERVKTVRRYMISKGISGGRIEVVGYGGEKPLSEGDSVSAREMNRRVEFVIIR